MTPRKERVQLRARTSKPAAPELDRRNREASLTQVVRLYSEAPSLDALADGWVGFFFNEDGLLVVRGYKNGKLSEIVGVEVV